MKSVKSKAERNFSSFVVLGFVVKYKDKELKTSVISPRRYHSKQAAEDFAQLAQSSHPGAYVSEDIGYDDI